MAPKPKMFPGLWLGVYFLVLVFSAIAPRDYFTWFLEVFPAILAFVILVGTYKRFQFTTLVYTLILIHCCILFVGGHYTYAEEPFFNWLKSTFHLARNNYDKVGHFAQGFVPAMVIREILIRRDIVKNKAWLFFIVTCICLAISASYELFEALVAVLTGSAADAFLGTQGDPWDTQTDMLMALIGAMIALGTLSRFQDREMFHVEHAVVGDSIVLTE